MQGARVRAFPLLAAGRLRPGGYQELSIPNHRGISNICRNVRVDPFAVRHFAKTAIEYYKNILY
jgi:hypothetical protein